MGIKITPDFNEKAIEKEVKQFIERQFQAALREFEQVGLQFVTLARNKNGRKAGSFDDQTGNLRSSIGFMIFYDGKEVKQNFQGNAQQGQRKGREYAKSLGEQFFTGWAIITVAGMEYASWVEGRGYDVITGSTLDSEQLMQEAIKVLKG